MKSDNRVVLTCVGGKDSYAVFEAANDEAAAVLLVGELLKAYARGLLWVALRCVGLGWVGVLALPIGLTCRTTLSVLHRVPSVFVWFPWRYHQSCMCRIRTLGVPYPVGLPPPLGSQQAPAAVPFRLL